MSGTIAQITSFTSGDIVVSVVGDGDGSGNYADNQASPIVLEELKPAGSIVGELTLPQITTTLANGTVEYAVSGEYGSSSEGSLELAANGQSLVIAGYGVNAVTYNTGGAATYGNAALAQSTSVPGGPYKPVARVVADIGANGKVDSSTAIFNIFNTNNPRSVATVDGSAFYLSGQGVKGDTTQGVFVANDGANSATSIDHGTDTRTVEIYNGSLFISRDSTQGSGGTSNISSYGTLPSGASTPSVLPGISQSITLTAAQDNSVNAAAVGSVVALSPENFYFASSTVLYVADGGNPKEGTAGDGGLQKWVLSNGTWTLAYTLSDGLNLVQNPSVNAADTAGSTGLIGLTGTTNPDGTVTLYTTNETIGDLDQTYLYSITDTLSAVAPALGESFTTLLAAAADTNVRGVALAPTLAATPANITIASGTTQTGLTIASGQTLAVLAGGTAASAVLLAGAFATITGTDTLSYVAEGATETVFGHVVADIIYGTQIVSSSGSLTGTVSNETVYNGGHLDLFIKGAVASGTTIAIGGVFNISGNATAANTSIMGGTLDLQSPKATLTGTLAFSGTGDLEIGAVTSAGYGETAVIYGFGQGDMIDEVSIGTGAVLTSLVNSLGNTVETISSGTFAQLFTFAGTYAPGFFELAPDAGTGIELIEVPPVQTNTTIAAGTSQSNITVASGSTLTVLGTAVNAVILQGGTELVQGLDTGAVISAGGLQNVSGSAAGDLIYGTQLVSAATAVVSNETVFNGGALDLYLKGASASSITVLSGGDFNISGNATASSVMLTGGTLNIQSPKAVFTDLTFSGTGAIDFSAVTSNTTLGAYGDLGPISNFGTGDVIDEAVIPSGATLTGSTFGGDTIETITGNGIIENFTFAGTYAPDYFTLLPDAGSGVELVISGTQPPVVSETIGSGTAQSNITIGSGTVLNVLAGGTLIDAVVLSGGQVNISGVDSGSTINAGGSETVLGSAANDLIFGTQIVSAATAVVSNETVFGGGDLELLLAGAVATGTTIDNSGTLYINGNATAASSVIMGGTLELGSRKANFGDVTFSGTGEILITVVSSAGYGDEGVIYGFGTGDVIDDTAIDASLTSSFINGNTVETITNGALVQAFTFAGAYAPGFFTLAPDGTTGSVLEEAPCFAAGTRILTPGGMVPVEQLAEGDLVITRSGAERPVTWVGRRRIDIRRHPRRHLVEPIRIAADALGEGMPARDLLVSPEHALFLDGYLVPAKALLNGRNIAQVQRDSVVYYHVELASHDVIFAENLAVETYLEAGNRGAFENGGTAVMLHPDFAQDIRLQTGCAPFAESGPVVSKYVALALERMRARRMAG